jgi:hypothetical protein
MARTRSSGWLCWLVAHVWTAPAARVDVQPLSTYACAYSHASVVIAYTTSPCSAPRIGSGHSTRYVRSYRSPTFSITRDDVDYRGAPGSRTVRMLRDLERTAGAASRRRRPSYCGGIPRSSGRTSFRTRRPTSPSSRRKGAGRGRPPMRRDSMARGRLRGGTQPHTPHLASGSTASRSRIRPRWFPTNGLDAFIDRASEGVCFRLSLPPRLAILDTWCPLSVLGTPCRGDMARIRGSRSGACPAGYGAARGDAPRLARHPSTRQMPANQFDRALPRARRAAGEDAARLPQGAGSATGPALYAA